jgi:alanine racemase
MEGPAVTVDLRSLRHNLGVLRGCLAPGVRLLAAVKADAYGHGARVVAPALERAGVDAFGVATAAEALALRRHGVTRPVLLFAPVRERIAELCEAGVQLTVADDDSLETIEAASPPRPAPIHLKLDTGMGRLGVDAGGLPALALAVARSRHARLEALWTHLACADEADADDPDGLTARQLARFEAGVAAVRAAGIEVPLIHAANSAATLRLPRSHYDLVRPGLALYGHHATPAAAALVPPDRPVLRPVATLRAAVTFVKRVPAGASVSYGATWRAPRETVVATVGIGYADGYPRAAGNQAEAVVHGQRVPVVGRVCMDQLMLDVGALADSVAVGDAVTLLGPDGPSAAALAARLDTVSYELLTHLNAPRVERRYLDANDGDGSGAHDDAGPGPSG